MTVFELMEDEKEEGGEEGERKDRREVEKKSTKVFNRSVPP